MHLARARVAQHLHDLARRVAAHDRVVDDDEALARHDLGQRVELQPQAVLAQLLAGLDERARDVAVLDEAVVLGQPAGARVARGRRRCRSRARRSRGRRPGRRLAREQLAHPPARGLQRLAAHARVRAARSRCTRRRRSASRAASTAMPRAAGPPRPSETISPGCDVAQQLGADDVEARTTRWPRSSARRAGRATSGRRPAGSRKRDDAVAGHDDGREGALQARHDVGDRVLDALGRVGGEQRGDDLRVAGRAERRRPARRSSACSSTALMRLPLWASASSRRSGAADDRLGVLPRARAGRRVADVADRHVAARARAARARRRPG